MISDSLRLTGVLALPQQTDLHADVEALRVFQKLQGHRRRWQRSPNLDDTRFLSSGQDRDLLDQAGRRGYIEDSHTAMQLGRRHVDRDVGESLQGRSVQRLQHRALNRVVHQLVPLIIHDLMRRGAGRGAAALSIMMRDRSPFPGCARVFLILERPVKTSGDGRHVVRADCRARDAVTAVGGKKKIPLKPVAPKVAASISETHSIVPNNVIKNTRS